MQAFNDKARAATRTTRHDNGEPMNLFDLSGRVAVVTGGNGGIGLGMAKAMAEAGCTISIWARNAEKNRAAEEVIAKAGGKVDSLIVDVADPASTKAACGRLSVTIA